MDQHIFSQFEKLNDRLTEIAVDMSSVKTSLEGIEKELKSTTDKVLDHENRLTKAEGTIESTKTASEVHSGAIDAHDSRIATLEGALKIAVWLIGILVVIGCGVAVKILAG